jgi:hypothetical protein
MELNPVIWIIFSGTSRDFKAYVLEAKILEIQIKIE